MICESSENYFLWAFSPTLAFSLWAFRPSLDFQPKWVESLRRLKATSYAVDGLLYAKCQKAIKQILILQKEAGGDGMAESHLMPDIDTLTI